MTDDTTKTGHDDRIRINVRQYHEHKHWCAALGVTKATLVAAVKAVGPLVKDVKAHLIERIKNAK